MATRIGEITFGIGINASGMLPGLKALRDFRQAVNKAAASSTAAGQQIAKGMAFSEREMRKALMTAQSLQSGLSRMGKDTQGVKEEIEATAKAFNRLTVEIKAADKDVIKIGRAFQTFNEKIAIVRTNMANIKAGGQHGPSKFVQTMRTLESSAVLAIGPLSGVGARLRSFGQIAARVKVPTLIMIGVIVALSVAFYKLAESILETAKIWDASMARFKAITGDMAAAKAEMNFVIATSNELGLRIDTAAKSFSRLTAASINTSLHGEGVRKIFHAVSVAAAALKLENGEVEGTFRAVEQMMSKGTVQAEELRGQLGERLPGAFRLWADSMGVSTAELGKLMKAGQVFAERDLLKFAEILETTFGEAAAENVKTYTGAVNLLSNSWLLFNHEMDVHLKLSGGFILAVKALTGLINLMTEAVRHTTSWLAGLTAAVLVFSGRTIALALWGMVTAMKTFSLATKLAATYQWALNAAMLANPFGATASLVVKLVSSLAALVGVYFAVDWAIGGADDAMEELHEEMAKPPPFEEPTEISEAFKAMKGSIDDAAASIRVFNAVNANTATNPNLDADKTFRFITAFEEAKKLEDKTQELIDTAAQLSVALKHEVQPTVVSIATALYDMGEAALDGAEKMRVFKEAPKALKEAEEAITDITKKLEQMGTQKELDFYNDVTSKVDNYVRSLDPLLISKEEIVRLTVAMTQALTDEMAATLRLAEIKRQADEAEKKRKQDAKDLQKAIDDAAKEAAREQARANKAYVADLDRLAKGFKKAGEETKLLKMKVAALSTGSDSLRIFEEIEGPMEVYIQNLKDAGATWAQMNSLVAEHRFLLEEQARLTDEWAQAGVKAANAIGDGLEDILTGASSLKDGFTGILDELWKILLRLLIIDPLVEALSTKMSGVMGGQGKGGNWVEKLFGIGMAAYGAYNGGSGGGGLPNLGGQTFGEFYGAGAGGGGGTAPFSYSGPSIFGPDLAIGGPVIPGKIHRVAERGPEMLTQGGKSYLLSDTKGRVMPLNSTKGGNVHVTVNVPPDRRRLTMEQEAIKIGRLTGRAMSRNS